MHILLLHNMLSLHNMQRRNIIGLSLHTKVPHLKLNTVVPQTMPGKTIIMPMTVKLTIILSIRQVG